MIKLSNLNKTKLYIVTKNDEYFAVYEDYEELKPHLEANPEYKVIIKDSYECIDDGFYDDDSNNDVTFIYYSDGNNVNELIFRNDIGLSISLLHLFFKDNNLNFKITKVVNTYLSGEYHIGFDMDSYSITEAIEALLDNLRYDNLSLVSNLIDYLIMYELYTIDDIKSYEKNYNLDYIVNGNKIKNIIESFNDICIYDCLTLSGMRTRSNLKELCKNALDIKEQICFITIMQIFSKYDIYYAYSFYKLIVEDKIVDMIPILR